MTQGKLGINKQVISVAKHMRGRRQDSKEYSI